LATRLTIGRTPVRSTALLGTVTAWRETTMTRPCAKRPVTSFWFGFGTVTRICTCRVANGVVERQEVELGLEDAATEQVEIRKGLAPGDTVLTGGVRSLPKGTPIRAQAPAERAASAPTN
jgi:hypothetical protein